MNAYLLTNEVSGTAVDLLLSQGDNIQQMVILAPNEQAARTLAASVSKAAHTQRLAGESPKIWENDFDSSCSLLGKAEEATASELVYFTASDQYDVADKKYIPVDDSFLAVTL